MRAQPVRAFQHVPQLDGIRAVAVAIVVVAHGGLDRVVPGGFGVTIFFFLSGYLITSLLRSEVAVTGTVSLKGFYWRRFLRIFPPLYITLLLTWAASQAGWFGNRVNGAAVPYDFLFLSNYAHLFGEENGLPIPLWSLAVEEHFYLLFPIVFVFVLARTSPLKAAQLCAAACVGVLALRLTTLAVAPEELWRNYYWTHTRIDSILFGSCLALWNNPTMDRSYWRPTNNHALFALGAILFTIVVRDPVFRDTMRYTVQGAALFVLFSYVLSDRSRVVNRVLESRPLRLIGLLSYTLYLIHLPVYVVLRESLNVAPVVSGVIGLPIALLYSWFMYKVVEKPLAEWRKRRAQPGIEQAKLLPAAE